MVLALWSRIALRDHKIARRQQIPGTALADGKAQKIPRYAQRPKRRQVVDWLRERAASAGFRGEMTPCYSPGVRDTSTEAARIQAAVHRGMGGVRKFLMACQMSDSVRAIARARIKSLHPEFDEIEIRDELIWELYGVRRGR